MLRKLIRAGAVVALFAGSASAQDSVGIPLNMKAPPSAEEIAKRKAADEAYSAAMHKIPDQKSSADPWGNIRPTTPTAPKNKQQ